MSLDPDIVLSCEGIHRFLGEEENGVHVLKDVSLQLHAQRVYSITGPSGCGKSTLLYLLGLLDRPDSGTIWISGQEVTELDDSELSLFRNQEIGFVFQFHFLFKEFSALENVQLPMLRAGILSREEMDDRAAYLLEQVGLGDKLHRNAHHLSGGEQQRVAIARALVNNPSLLLADEPTGNLDSRTSVEIMDIFQKLNDEHGLTVVIVTHEPDIAQYAKRALEFRDGKMKKDVIIQNRSIASEVLPTLPSVDEDLVGDIGVEPPKPSNGSATP